MRNHSKTVILALIGAPIAVYVLLPGSAAYAQCDGTPASETINCNTDDTDGANLGGGNDVINIASGVRVDTSNGGTAAITNTGNTTVNNQGPVVGVASGHDGINVIGDVERFGSSFVSGDEAIEATGNVRNSGSGNLVGDVNGIVAGGNVINDGSGDVTGGFYGIFASGDVTNAGSGDVRSLTAFGIGTEGNLDNSSSGLVSGNIAIVSFTLADKTFNITNGTITGNNTAIRLVDGDDTVNITVGVVTINGIIDGGGHSTGDTINFNGVATQAEIDAIDAAFNGCNPCNGTITAGGKNYTFINFESLQHTLVILPSDFGDAPNTYGTTSASSGAEHPIVGSIYLGVRVDDEADGQPNATATGDDGTGDDDEDGVTFGTVIIGQGNTESVSVIASSPGFLNAWVDFNLNGNFTDSGEQIFTDVPLSAGTNSISFTVPIGATRGNSFARFRFTSYDTAGALGPTGPANDGEIEDYQVEIGGSEIQVEDSTPTTLVDDVSSVNLGTTTQGAPINETFTITNLGNTALNLTGTAPTIPAGYSTTNYGATSLPNTNDTTTITLTCDATSTGTFTGTVSIVSNDADEIPFTFSVTCQVDPPPAPEIQVEAPTILTDGASGIVLGPTTQGTSVNQTVTITNLGSAELTLSGTAVAPIGFSTSNYGATSLPNTNDSTTFILICDATTSGFSAGTVSISSNDADENPFTFTVSCQVNLPPAPEIQVQDGAATILLDGSSSINLGTTTQGTAINEVFTITNLGDAELTLTGAAPTIPAGYSTTNYGSTSLPNINDTTSFTLTCDASTTGTFMGTITIANNDANENPFTFDVTCVVDPAPAPEIQVEEASVLVDGVSTVDFGTTTQGTSVNRVITITNLGDAELTLTGAAATIPAGYANTTYVTNSLSNTNDSTTFGLTCDASSPGTFTGTVSIINNDADENPFTFDVTCVVDPAPALEIQVQDGSATILTSGVSTVDLGATTQGTSVNEVFTITNLGNAELTLMGAAPTIPADYSTTNYGAASLPNTNDATTFTLTCDATAIGTFMGTVSIASNDADENPFTVDVTCQVDPPPAPEIQVEDGAPTILSSGVSTVDLGVTTQGTPIDMIFTITNLGSAELTLTGAAPTIPADYSTSNYGATSLPNTNDATTFTLTCDATAIGTFTGTVSIASNDADENPFTFDVQCEVSAVPASEIQVEDETPVILITGTSVVDLGTTAQGAPITETITIRNLGNAELTLTGAAPTVPTDYSTTNYGVMSLPNTNDTTTFTLTCEATAIGTFTGTVSIASNDVDENPFTFDVTCQVNVVVDDPPTVTSTSPSDGTLGAPSTTTIVINFSEPVSLTANAITVECPLGALITFTGLPATNVNTITLTPDTILPLNTICTVVVLAAGVTDLDGTLDPLAADYTFTFAVMDNAPPIDPGSGGGGSDASENTVLLAEATPTQTPLAPDDFVFKMVDKGLVQIGDTVTYTITVSNPTDRLITTGAIRDDFDTRFDNVTLMSTSAGVGTVNGQTLAVDAITLEPGQSATVIVTAQVSGRANPGDEIFNVAIFSYNPTYTSNIVKITVLPNALPETGGLSGSRTQWLSFVGWLVLAILGLIGISMRYTGAHN